MLDTTTLNKLAELSHAQLLIKLASVEEILFVSHLEIEDEDHSAETYKAVTELNNKLYKAIYNKDLY